MCDSDKHRLLQVFDRIEAAIAHGTQVVMVGQGIGPMEDLELLQRAKEVLCHIDYIMIREERIARPLLDSLDVPRSKVFMTGDDAIELAYQARNRNLGNGIGLSLRVAHYTGLNKKHLEVIRSSVIHAAEKFGAQLIAAPIDVNDADKFIVDNMIKDYLKTSLSWRRFETPKQIIKRIGQCRIMVSGTFHGAVFALGQGIPVVALAVTDEYNKKLGGLTAEFGENGCQIVNIDENDSGQRLMEAIEIAWSSAEQLRTELLWNAKRQIDLGYEAYEKIFQLVNSDLRVS
jgi:colanic acid/amylovoran biosynthesis protein